MKTWDSSSWPLPEVPRPNQVLSNACKGDFMIRIKFVARIVNWCIRKSFYLFTGESDSKVMASSTFSFMEFTFSTVASLNKITFSAADSFPSTTFSFTVPQMLVACSAQV